jgi:hypothetical protein
MGGALGMGGIYLVWLALDTGPFFVGLMFILGAFAGIGVVDFAAFSQSDDTQAAHHGDSLTPRIVSSNGEW